MKLFVPRVHTQPGSYARQLAGYLRGQWVVINGLLARIVNHTGNRVVVMFKGDRDIAVFG